MMWTDLIPIAGLIIGFILFYRYPILSGENINVKPEKVSVIIPVRNEEENLALLLADLKNQNLPLYEVICVDDQSEDGTAEVAASFAASFNVRLVAAHDKPADWTGKAWACQLGADQAGGNLLLFLDADVRLHPDAIGILVGNYQKFSCALSVQPYHGVKKCYEQLSLFFNLILIAANGVGLCFVHKNIGLFGPVILIDRVSYNRAGGHVCAKDSIVDDLTLGENLENNSINYQLFLGDETISFRMYPAGLSSLIQGWTKNFATGASKTPLYLVAMVILWIGACIYAAYNLVLATTSLMLPEAGFYLLFYLVIVFQLWRAAGRVGSFKKWTILLYPLPLLFFLLLFLVSIYKKLFRRSATWKGRMIDLRS
jgi:4,4'-diaponeurosporenoate glycosyltransferase